MENENTKLIELLESFSENLTTFNCKVTKKPDALGYCGLRMDFIDQNILNLMAKRNYKLVSVSPNKIETMIDVSIKYN